ncbi:MAG: DedA protein [Phycisphaerales bacterium]|nr:DedA protein [Phycisphaerales bacterium]
MEILGLINLEHVAELMDIGWAGYVVLFGLLFSCGLGMPLPEDIPLLVAGMLHGAGKMHMLPLALAAWCGIVGGDCILYYLGHRFGLNITKVPVVGKHVTKERILRAEKLFEKYGVWVVAVGRLFAGIRGAMVVAAGTIRFNFIKFLIADGLAALLSGGLFVWLGMKFGQNLHYISKKIHEYGEWVFIGIVLSALIVAGYYWWRRSGHRGATDIAVDTIEKVAEKGIHLPLPGRSPEAKAGKDATARG